MTRPVIVAEMSCNHLGSLDRAMAIIDAAADAGADAIKFQLFDPRKMAPDGMVIAAGPWKGANARELYWQAMTPREWFVPMINRAYERGIEWFSSVFDLDGIAFLESIGCSRYKISSFEIVDLALVRAVAATRKAMVISTGMATQREIQEAAVAADGTKHLTLLKCTSAYPAPDTDINLAAMRWLGCFPRCDGVGISDHTHGSAIAVAATALGATMIEKHLTLLRSDGGPDAAFSMEPHEFADMVVQCRRASDAIGAVRYGPTESEKPQTQLRGRTLMHG